MTEIRDVMQVCRNGHVVTDQFHAIPVSRSAHCVKCGETTLWQCETCGHPLQGAKVDLGLTLVGHQRPSPYCPACGAAFPWAQVRRQTSDKSALEKLTGLLRRLPRVV